ncbi:hypothetical protein E4T56_gene20871 [Termitomyces sp. T112]|nr:hypothetical protein E4T56_gene20871 [Termitomyces sp. T112]
MADALTPDTDSVYFDAPTQQQPSTMFSEQSSNRGLSASAPTKRPNGGVPPPDVTEKDSPVHRSNSSTSWLPAVDFPPEDTQPVHFAQAGQDLRAGNANLQVGNPPHRAIGARSPSPRRGSHMRSPSPPAHRALDIRSPSPAQGTSAQGASDIRRSASRRSMFTSGSTGHPIEGSTFIGGAATTGPHSTALPDQELTTRAAAADANLSRKDRSRIAKSEAEDGKQLSKIIKDEGRAEKQALGLAIRELAMLQKDQANAIQNEAKAHEQRKKLQAEYQKQESLFFVARTRYEAAQARLHAEDEALEIVRNKARDATERLQDKSQEVDSLRTMFAVDERERAAKLATINEKPQRSGSGCIIA